MGSGSGSGGRWLASLEDEESRSYLQTRMVLLSKVMLGTFAALTASVPMVYRLVPQIEPRESGTIMAISIGGLVIALLLWRLLVRRPVSLPLLFAIEAFYSAGGGVVFGSAAYLGRDLVSTQFINFIWLIILVFVRALLVPSTARRTAVMGAIAFAPMCLAALGIARETDPEFTDAAFIAGSIVIGLAVTGLSAFGSSIIYGLRRQVRKAERLGQYTLDRKIGEGGMGAVYLAHHALLRRPTAIKMLLPDRVDSESLARFEREVQHMSQLTHANTVAVYDYGRSVDGIFYYAMEYLGGGIDLERLVSNYGPQPTGRVIQIVQQVCRALQEAHDKGIIHRDIKPANILLCERGGEPDVVKVVDYGLVREVERDPAISTNVVVGTPAYLAPEAITNSTGVGPAADLYALGCVAYYLLTGKRVFEGATAIEVCIKHVATPPTPPSQISGGAISAEIDALVLSCLAKAPADRPRDAGTLLQGLRAIDAGDWSELDARRWWKEHRGEMGVPSPDAATVTLAVDLGERQAVH